MAMITDVDYALQAIRLSALRTTDDQLTPRIITLDPSFGLNPYINASGLSDIDRWPEIKRALDSPPPERIVLSSSADESGAEMPDRSPRNRAGEGEGQGRTRGRPGVGGLRYTQTIVGPGRSGGGAGMRVSGRTAGPNDTRPNGRRELASRPSTQRSNSSSTDVRPVIPSYRPAYPSAARHPPPTASNDLFTSPSTRPRADSAPAPLVLGLPATSAFTSMSVARGIGTPGLDSTPLDIALSLSEMSGGIDDDDEDGDGDGDLDIDDEIYNGDKVPSLLLQGTMATSGFDPGDSMGASGIPSDMALTVRDGDGTLDEVDEGSDVDEGEVADEDMPGGPVPVPVAGARRTSVAPPALHDRRRVSVIHEEGDRRSSTDTNAELRILDFPRAVPQSRSSSISTIATPYVSALTAALNHHVPHLVSTSSVGAGGDAVPSSSTSNPFASIYASVAAPPTVPSLALELYFPHSDAPGDPLHVKVRRDATVEEATGHGLWKYWDSGREPRFSEDDGEEVLSTVGWGLRIVEDDGEVDEDFPPLDRESQISKFSYGQFAIVQATDSQKKQNVAMAPHIQRRPSRIIADPLINKPAARGRQTNLPPVPQASTPLAAGSLSSSENLPLSLAGTGGVPLGATINSGVGLSSATSKQVLLRVRVSASADVHFTTTISVPADMYIADLTEVLCTKKRLSNAPSEWVLCLADLTLALPLDRTVASLEGKTDLALVRRQWASEHGLRPGDRRGGDPSASIFTRATEPAPHGRLGPAVADFTQTYKKYTVQRKTPIGRHERVLAIDGDYIHIMPSENRAFFDSMKTTSFHITLVVSCKLSGRAGGFKIYVWRDGNQKRYEFEAENGRQANEIITSIKQMMKMYQSERSSVVGPPRSTSVDRR